MLCFINRDDPQPDHWVPIINKAICSLLQVSLEIVDNSVALVTVSFFFAIAVTLMGRCNLTLPYLCRKMTGEKHIMQRDVK